MTFEVTKMDAKQRKLYARSMCHWCEERPAAFFQRVIDPPADQIKLSFRNFACVECVHVDLLKD